MRTLVRQGLMALSFAGMLAACEHHPYNLITGLDCYDRQPPEGDCQKPPKIAGLEINPAGPIFLPEVGYEVFFEIKAVDQDGNPLPNTETFINPLYDKTMLELVYACGGNDTRTRTVNGPRPECAGLVPSFHTFDNDGVMWVRFRALDEGTTTIQFAYPGHANNNCIGLGCEPGTEGQPYDADGSGPEVGHYKKVVDVEVIIGGTPSDTDDDGVPDDDDDCPNTPPNTVVDGDGCPLAPADADGDGVSDADDDCPNTPANTPVDANGCPTTADHPTISQIAPRNYIFRKQGAQLGCTGTVTHSNAAASASNLGGLTPLLIDTFFTSTFGSPTSTVRGPYNSADGTYIANGQDDFGNVHELDGVWTIETDGDPRFDGTLVERKFSPTCENTFGVTYTID